MSRKHIILILIPNLGPGGAQQVFREQVRFLAQHFVVVPCAFNLEGAFDYERSGQVVSLDIPAGKNPFHKAWCFAKRVRQVRRLKRRRAVTVSISHLEGADYINILSKGDDNTILWVHGTKQYDQDIKGITGWIRKKILIPWLYQKADNIATVSEGIRLELLKNFLRREKPIAVIYNGVDAGAIQAQSSVDIDPRVEQLCKSYFVIITHCRLVAQKNILSLIRIAARLKELESIKWVILGDGEQRKTLTYECENLGVAHYQQWTSQTWSEDNQIFFLGYQKNPFPLLRKSGVYVTTSLWEGFPLALCEALACRLPIIAADCFTGPRELLAPELSDSEPVSNAVKATYGILMPLVYADDSDSLDLWSDFLKNFLLDEELQQHYRSVSNDALRRFSVESVQTRTLELIKSAETIA